jgi:hypothetical protein
MLCQQNFRHHSNACFPASGRLPQHIRFFFSVPHFCMQGIPSQPMCGFSSRVVSLLNGYGVQPLLKCLKYNSVSSLRGGAETSHFLPVPVLEAISPNSAQGLPSYSAPHSRSLSDSSDNDHTGQSMVMSLWFACGRTRCC